MDRARVRALALLALTAVLTWYAVRKAEVPLLDYVDLGFHELAHMLTIPFGERVHFLAGSVGQVLVPVALGGYFLWRNDQAAAGLMGGWAATSAADVSIYVADAPTQYLPLIGGGMHDWATLLGPRHFNAMHYADELARDVWRAGMLLAFVGLALCVYALVAPQPGIESESTEMTLERTTRDRRAPI